MVCDEDNKSERSLAQIFSRSAFPLNRPATACPAASPNAMARHVVKTFPMLAFKATTAVLSGSPVREETLMSSMIIWNMATAAPSGMMALTRTTG